MKKFNTIFETLIGSTAFIAGFFIFAMIFIEMFEVAGRFLFGKPLAWSVEVIEYMLFLIPFLATTWLLKEKGHITVSLIYERLNPGIQIYCDLLASGIGIIISMIIICYSLESSLECYIDKVKVVKTLAAPKYVFLLFIFFGYLLLSIEFMKQFWSTLKKLYLDKQKIKNIQEKN